VPAGKKPNLTPRNDLPPDERKVQEESIAQLKAAPKAFVDKYAATYGNHISSDNAAELFPCKPTLLSFVSPPCSTNTAHSGRNGSREKAGALRVLPGC
jgi:hypothetical protein